MEKWATPTGTEKFFQWNPIEPSKQKLFDGLHLSALGAGTHLGPADEPTDRLYEQTLLQAALSGLNCFDTAISDREQRSERVLKKVFKELANRGIFRDQIFVSTKGGLISAESKRELLATGTIESKDIVDENHCLAPQFLSHQINASLKNLGLECIDLYYLQNPEIELKELGEAEFYNRLELAFTLLEEKVRERKIARYGLATWNGFRQKKGQLSLKRVVECARKVGGEGHHLKAIQVPFNLVMLEALKEDLFDLAREQGIAVMVSACLMQSQVTHLPHRLYEKLPPASSETIQAIQFVLSTPGLTTAYIGMKRAEHLAENRSVLKEPMWPKDLWLSACNSLGL
jgi:aryl-alcohol dehydrogenase-like predicted oxidoreductase